MPWFWQCCPSAVTATQGSPPDSGCAGRPLPARTVTRHKSSFFISGSTKSTRRKTERLEQPQECAAGDQCVFLAGLSRTLPSSILFPEQHQGFHSSCLSSNSTSKSQMTAWGWIEDLLCCCAAPKRAVFLPTQESQQFLGPTPKPGEAPAVPSASPRDITEGLTLLTHRSEGPRNPEGPALLNILKK